MGVRKQGSRMTFSLSDWVCGGLLYWNGKHRRKSRLLEITFLKMLSLRCLWDHRPRVVHKTWCSCDTDKSMCLKSSTRHNASTCIFQQASQQLRDRHVYFHLTDINGGSGRGSLFHSTFTGQYRIPGPMPGSEQVEDIVRLRNATVKSITMNWKSLSRVQLFATPWTVQSVEFSRPEYWSG